MDEKGFEGLMVWQKAGEKEPGANIPVWEIPAEYFVEEINEN